MPVGDELYKRYYYLWHLVAINAISVPTGTSSGEVCPTITGVEWDFAGRDVKIGLIDMGVARHHPNLEAPEAPLPPPDQVIWNDAIDLASHPYGAKYEELSAYPAANRHRELPEQHLTGISALVIPGLDPEETEIINRISNGFGVKRYVDAYDDRYAAHGTGCAGLTSGTSYELDQFGNAGNIAPYFGVDPLSKVVPITTSISPSPEELIAAFLYAEAKGVDVILFPRDAADPSYWPGYPTSFDDDEETRLHKSKAGEVHEDILDIQKSWALLEKVIEWVSKQTPVVCAAGNEGRSELIYPASLSSNSANGVISVGAVNYNGYRSGYSNYSGDLTVVAPSDDGEVYNRYQIRLDRRAASAGDFWVENVHKKREPPYDDIPEISFASQRLLSLDVPGPRGYVEGTFAGPVKKRESARDDPSGLYAEFGGTSGAAALVAGAIAMMQRKSTSKVSGVDVKNIFEGFSADTNKLNLDHWYWLDAGSSLQPDAMNSYTTPSTDELFGQAGLLDVAKLLLQV